jgi:hypothetical protein
MYFRLLHFVCVLLTDALSHTHIHILTFLGPVAGISLKLQEEERERRENYIPPVSFLVGLQENIEIDHVSILILLCCVVLCSL